MTDMLIKNAKVVDGSGKPAYKADIAIKDGKITSINSPDHQFGTKVEADVTAEAHTTIDAAGLVAAPGFIDVHGHSDMFAILDPGRASKLCQGITTEICGQCGLGPAPVSEEYYDLYKMVIESLGAPIYPNSKEFTSFGTYLDFLETLSLGINTAYFIPHGAVRLAVMGMSPEKPTPARLERMRDMIRNGMENGALGLSSGLMYAPGIFADEDEFAALCEAVGEYDGIYTSHIRDQGVHVEECVAETIRVAKRAKVRANISHNKASGKENWGKVVSTIKMIRDADIPVRHDVYPYTAGSSTLKATLPPHLQKLPNAELIAHLNDPDNHDTLKDIIFNPPVGFESPLKDSGYDGLMIFHAAKTHDVIGKTVEQYASEMKTDPFTAYLKILIDNEFSAGYIGFSMSEDDVRMLLADPLCMYGTDALYVEGMPMTHPRAIGTFPRILGHYVRELNLLSLEEAVRKMTSMPAEFYGLKNKGLLKEGMDADLVIFDPDTITDKADYKQPLLPNEGIFRMIINGKEAVAEDKALGVLNGSVLRKSI